MPFLSPGPFGVEVMSFRRLRAIAPTGYLKRPQRPEFHLLIWVEDGPGTQAAALAEERFGPALRRPRPGAGSSVGRAVEHLRAEYGAAGRSSAPTRRQHELLRHLLSALLLRVEDCAVTETAAARPDDTFACFRETVDRDFAAHRDVAHYARTLGWSPRTLSRAARKATGANAKQVIDGRVVLEARRLLAHTELPVTTIAQRLGFEDASNFSSYFARTASTSPTAFRDSLR